MDIDKIKSTMQQNANAQKAKKMSDYMRGQFEYFGIPTPTRRDLCKPFWDKKTASLDWKFVMDCWNDSHREMQQIAMDYLRHHYLQIVVDDIPKLRQLVETKSWWDTIDGLNWYFGFLTQIDSSIKQLMLEYSLDDNFWIRRISINHQIGLKDKTDELLLQQIILNNFGSKEFFINKAIGWALREYSKTNPNCVVQFVDNHREKMSVLSVREATKRLIH
ncbi:MAG: DNA alkylation repair protein [Firmicutes bacterium]|nr:DNA alkylation repair protein [Bacillota bacterium]MCL1953576.1 DNA alkylation repair protein [Bacillota bacterium]